jgi:hypothetical protein
MKTNFFNYLFLFMAIAIIGEGIYIFILRNKSETVQQSQDFTKAAANDFKLAVVHHKDATGHDHVVVSGQPNVFTSAAIAADSVVKNEPDSIAALLKIKTAQITYWEEIASVNERRALKAEHERDSHGNLLPEYEYHDNSLDLVFHTNTAEFDVKKKDSLNHIDYFTKSWFLGPKHYYSDILYADTATRINGLKRMVINTDHNTDWNLKGQVRATYLFGDGYIVPAAGLILSKGPWDIMASYYYSRSLQHWEPRGTIAYNFFSLH